jgi:hypothetical protein
MSTQVGYALRRAAQIAERLDHCKGLMFVRDRDKRPVSCCTIGAVQLACFDLDLDASVFKRALQHLYLMKPEFNGEIGIWNDKPETRKDDVVALLRQAADDLDPPVTQASRETAAMVAQLTRKWPVK